MGKLHELLAVEGDKKGIADKVLNEGKVTFTKRADHFTGHVKTIKFFDEARNDLEGGECERSEIVTTVMDKLQYIMGSVAEYYDITLQKESTNQQAVADLIVDGKTLSENLPATYLLGLETKLKSLRDLVGAIPTLQPGISWVPDVNAGEGIYKREHPEETFKTEKIIKPFVLAEATKEHKAQIERLSADVNIGKYTSQSSSSMLTSAAKSAMLGRVDNLIQAVKKARQQANNINVVDREIGENIVSYIMG